MQKSAISWTNETWNPVSGCSKVSDGCKFCYAMTLSLQRGWTTKPWTLQNEEENIKLKPHKLHEPYKLVEPQRVFVNSMSDLHHRTIPDWYRAAVWCVMLDLPQHVFQVLTKRSESLASWHDRFVAALQTDEFAQFRDQVKDKRVKAALGKVWTTPWAAHIWQGVSVEDSRVLHRLDDLRACGAQVKFVSAEPLLGAWGEDANIRGLDWIIVGGESGQHMKSGHERWMQQEWARQIKRLCIAERVAFFYKQDSGHTTELRPYLVEENGSKWIWWQYPGDLVPPRLSDYKTREEDEWLYTQAPTKADETFIDEATLEQCLIEAARFDKLAISLRDQFPLTADRAVYVADYWRAAAARQAPPDPPSSQSQGADAPVEPSSSQAFVAPPPADQMPLFRGYANWQPEDTDWGSKEREACLCEGETWTTGGRVFTQTELDAVVVPEAFEQQFYANMHEFADQGLITLQDGKVAITDSGRAFVAAHFEHARRGAQGDPPALPALTDLPDLPGTNVVFMQGHWHVVQPGLQTTICGVPFYAQPINTVAPTCTTCAAHNFVADDVLDCEPLITGAQALPAIFLGWGERAGWAKVELPPPYGTVEMHMSGLSRPAAQPKLIAPQITVGIEVEHTGTKERGIVRRLDDHHVYVQMYGADRRLITVSNPDGSPVLVEWLRRHVQPVRQSDETWWIDEDDNVFRLDSPSADAFAVCRGPFDSETDARRALRPTWVQAPDAATAQRQMDEHEQWVHQVNSEARRLDQEWNANIARKRAQGVLHFGDPDMGNVLLGKLMKPETDAFVQLASGGTSASSDVLMTNAPKSPDPEPIPFGEGERVIVRYTTSAYQLDPFEVYMTLPHGQRVVYLRPLMRDVVPFAVVRTATGKELAVSQSVLIAPVQVGEILRFAADHDGEQQVAQYRCTGTFTDGRQGNWMLRYQDDQPWTPVGNPDFCRRLDLRLNPMPDDAVITPPAPTKTPVPHAITVCTSRIGFQDTAVLDITVKSASTPEGKLFAPTWDMVMGVKEGRLSTDEYTKRYKALMATRYRQDKGLFLDVLHRDRVVLVCYCAAGEFCHRHLAVEILRGIANAEGITFVDGGELAKRKPEPAPALEPVPAAEQQLALF